MRSLTAGLARQVMVAAAMGALLISGLGAQRNESHRQTATQAFDLPIPTRAIVIAGPAPAAAKSAPAAKSSAAARPATRPHVAAAETQRPLATPVVAAAYVAPAPEAAEPPFNLRKRLFAPVGFVRDNVVRLISLL